MSKYIDDFMMQFSKIDLEANQRITFAVCNQHLSDIK